MVVKIRNEDLVGVRAHGHAIQMSAQTAHTCNRRRVQHTQDGAIDGQHLHAMLVSDYQESNPRQRYGTWEGKLPRTRAFRAQMLPNCAVAQAPQGQPMIGTIGNDNNGALLQI